MNVSILYPVSLAMCVCLLSVSLFYLAVKFSTNSVLQSYLLGLERCYFSIPSRRKLQEMATRNFQVEQIRLPIGYRDFKYLSSAR